MCVNQVQPGLHVAQLLVLGLREKGGANGWNRADNEKWQGLQLCAFVRKCEPTKEDSISPRKGGVGSRVTVNTSRRIIKIWAT